MPFIGNSVGAAEKDSKKERPPECEPVGTPKRTEDKDGENTILNGMTTFLDNMLDAGFTTDVGGVSLGGEVKNGGGPHQRRQPLKKSVHM